MAEQEPAEAAAEAAAEAEEQESESRAPDPVDWCELFGQELYICTGHANFKPEDKKLGANLLAAIGSGIGVKDPSKDWMDGFKSVQTSIVLPKTLKLLLVYFSGRWCPMCQAFDVMMRKVYEGLKALPESSDLELVWISCDLSEEAHHAHLKTLRVMLGASWSPSRLAKFTERWGVKAIPSLLVLDAHSGKSITSSGSEDIQKAHDGSSQAHTMDADGFAGLFLNWSELLDQQRASDDHGIEEDEEDSDDDLSEGSD